MDRNGDGDRARYGYERDQTDGECALPHNRVAGRSEWMDEDERQVRVKGRRSNVSADPAAGCRPWSDGSQPFTFQPLLSDTRDSHNIMRHMDMTRRTTRDHAPELTGTRDALIDNVLHVRNELTSLVRPRKMQEDQMVICAVIREMHLPIDAFEAQFEAKNSRSC